MAYKILIIEDEETMRQELKQLLENALYQVVMIERFEQEVDQIILENPDLVLLDVNLPKEDGLSICMNLRKQSDVPIIFVTSNNTSMDELNCMMRGGDDYVAKPYQASILLARIAAVLKRTAKAREGVEETAFVHKEVTLDVASGIVHKAGKKMELSRNEIKILYYLFLHKETIVSRLELVEYLWDNQVFVDDNALSVNITRIRDKLERIGVTDFIKTKRGMGYII